MKAVRQPYRLISATTSGGDKAAPSLDPAWVIPCAKPRSEGNSQRESERVAMGNAPASPTPNRKRTVTIETAFQASVVAEVKIDHQVTIQVRARRGPTRSPSQPPGI